MSKKIDVLNRETFVNKLKILVEMLANKKQGCCFGIDGAWGSGKSFVLEMLEEQLKDIQLEETKDNKYFVFHYDCWKYDYYEEPAIAIISSMQDVVKEEISMFTESTSQNIKLAWRTVETTLGKIAGEFCKNKIGVDLVDIAKDVLKENDAEKNNNEEFDKLYGFKRALQAARENIQDIAKNKTVIIVVDELDRCLPTYSIKVLERLHHIFVDIENVIVIISVDKTQLTHSIHQIYGGIEVDTYLRKFISFRVSLDKGRTKSFFEKFATYTDMFEYTDIERNEIEQFFSDYFYDYSMRDRESIFRKAEYIHNILKEDTKYDCSIMAFEVLYLSLNNLNANEIAEVVKSTNLSNRYNENREALKLFDTVKSIRETMQKGIFNGIQKFEISNEWKQKMMYWMVNVFFTNNNGHCASYYCSNVSQEEIKLLKDFSEIIKIIDIN